jgi:hypothetical protein
VPAFFLNELNADHGGWVYGGPDDEGERPVSQRDFEPV